MLTMLILIRQSTAGRQPDSIKSRSGSGKPSPAALIRAAFNWFSSGFLITNKKREAFSLPFLIGAGNRTRTGTLLTARDFKSLVSTDFTMPALVTAIYYHIFYAASSHS